GQIQPVDTMLPRPLGKRQAVINRAGRSCLSVWDAALADQPAMDDIPFVPPPGLEVEQGGALVLKLEIEFQLIPAGGLAASARLDVKPSVPFLHHQSPGVLLLHPRGPNTCRPHEEPQRTRWSGSREKTPSAPARFTV